MAQSTVNPNPNPEPLSDAALARLEALYDERRATRLPVDAVWCEDYLYAAIRHVQRNCDIPCAQHEDDPDDQCGTPHKYDGQLIAALHNAFPALVSRLRLAEAARDDLRFALLSVQEQVPVLPSVLAIQIRQTLDATGEDAARAAEEDTRRG